MDANYFNDWLRAKDAADLIGVVGPQLYPMTKIHRVATQVVFGRLAFYKPDCERLRDHLAKVRAEREAKQAAA